MLQAEKEEAGIAKLQASLPTLCQPVLALALKECNADADRALLMLRQFQSDMFDELATLHRRRRKLEAQNSGADERGKSERHRKHDRGQDSLPRRRHKSKSKHRDEKGKRAKHKQSKDSKHKRKKRRRSDSDAESAGAGSSGSEEQALEFGSFGIIRESDYALKKPEFAAWASEIKKIDIESLPKCA